MTDTDELRRLLGAATPGPWFQEGTLPNEYVYGMVRGGRPNGEGIVTCRYYSKDRDSGPNAALIAAAVTALPALLDELDKLRAVAAGSSVEPPKPADDELRRFRLLAVQHRHLGPVGIAVQDFRGLWYVHHAAGNDGPISERELRGLWDCTPELDNHHNAARCPYCTPTLVGAVESPTPKDAATGEQP